MILFYWCGLNVITKTLMRVRQEDKIRKGDMMMEEEIRERQRQRDLKILHGEP